MCWGVVDSYSFSRFHDNVSLQDFPAIQHIKRACERDVNYIWLLNGAKAPSHFEIARFQSKLLSECAEEIFKQLVTMLHKMGEINYEHLFVDGTKIEANANKYSFVWKKSTNKYELKLVVSRVMRKIDISIWQKSITGERWHALVIFRRSGRKGSSAASAARLALDSL